MEPAIIKEGFLFVINHEAPSPGTQVFLSDLEFEIGQIVDLGSGKPATWTVKDGALELSLSVPVGQTQILHLMGK